jgi:antitoxin YefM
MGQLMAREVSYSEAREHLADLWDRALADREPIRLTRRGSEAVVLLAADEYEGLLETAHLLRSPANAVRLLSALQRAEAGDGEPKTLNELRTDFGRAEEA